MNKIKMVFDKELDKFISSEVVPMSDSEAIEKQEIRLEHKIKNNLMSFREYRKQMFTKYDIYSLRVVRNKIQEDSTVEQWYQTMLDFTDLIAVDTFMEDWPLTPQVIQDL